MDLESKKVLHFLQGAHKGSVRNATVDPQLEYLTTMGCDGFLHINRISDTTCVKKVKISNWNVLNFSHKNFDLVWSPDGANIYIAGNPALFIQSRAASAQDNTSKFNHAETANITLVDMPSQDVLITVGTDLVLKVWNRNTEKMTHCFKTDK